MVFVDNWSEQLDAEDIRLEQVVEKFYDGDYDKAITDLDIALFPLNHTFLKRDLIERLSMIKLYRKMDDFVGEWVVRHTYN